MQSAAKEERVQVQGELLPELRSSVADVVVLGAGPAGLGAAYRLTAHGVARVTVLEQRDTVGGNAGSFELEGINVDFGSHRLHPACDVTILNELRSLLGEDLLDRPRHGRIRLGGRWIHFPLKPADLLLRTPKRFAFGVAMDMVRKLVPTPNDGDETFATVLQRGLGRTICEQFYFPYARKLWGLDPRELAVTQAKRRVSGNTLGKMIRKVASAVPGVRKPGAGRFFYPRRGFGQISHKLREVAEARGAEIVLGARVTALNCERNRVVSVQFQSGGEVHEIRASHVWSTLPVTLLVRAMRPQAPPEILGAASSIRFRGMILVYLVLEQDRFTEYDAHYFPETDIAISRLSEPKNYSASREPVGRTVLCAELPADPGSREWQLSDADLGQLVCQALSRAGLPVPTRVLRVVSRKLGQAYPIYQRDYERHFRSIDQWLGGFENLLTFGRQGLFAHDNTHHALYMAWAAADCLNKGGFDRARWGQYRQVFETHVVED